jgi:2-polyprenyl-6-methoxyphenol hydroxylase-like FAD-dependent oxidoreductase
MFVDVLVVGAGPVGLTMACELARHGVRCRIIDKVAAPAVTSRALAIFPRTLEVFQMMGIIDPIIDAGHQLSGVAFYNHDGQIGYIGFSCLPCRYRFAISLPQTETERILIEHLASFGIQVDREKELIGLSQSSDKVCAVLRDSRGIEEASESSWLIGCDGAHSDVRHLLGLRFEGDAYPETFLLADAMIDSPLDHINIHLFLASDGLVGIFPFRGYRCRILANIREEENERTAGEPRLDEIQAMVDRRAISGIRLSDPVWLSRFHISHRKVPEFSSGRVFLAGDSAHIHSPAGGQGMNTGIQDAFNLAWKVALVVHGKSPSSFLNSYNEEREPVAKMVLSLTDGLTRMATSHSALGQQLRNALLPILTGIHSVEDRIAETMAEIGIHYRRSSAISGKTGHTVKAGDRAPDGELEQGAGKDPLRLLDLFRKPVHHLLLFAGMDADSALEWNSLLLEVKGDFKDLIDASVVIRGQQSALPYALFDSDGAVHALYEAESPALVLIRPDGYIGFRGGARHADALREHLALIFSVRPDTSRQKSPNG